MSSTIDHIKLANKNHRALLYLLEKSDEHPEWVATVAFYKAVHVVEAVFAADGKHSNSHDARISELKFSKYKEIFKAYRPLYAASLVGRYLADSTPYKLDNGNTVSYCSFEDYMTASDVVKRLIKKRLKVIEDNAVRFLSDTQKELLLRVGENFSG